MNPPLVFVAIPSYSRMVPQMVQSLYAAVLSGGIAPYMDYHVGDTVISRVRNSQLTRFYLKTKCEWYFQISDDIEIVDCNLKSNIFKKLMAHNLPFIGGLYPPSMMSDKKCTSELIGEEGVGPLVGVKYLSGGCWLLHRSVVGTMMERYASLDYHAPDGNKGVERQLGLFLEEVVDEGPYRRHLSEDFAFCHRWRECGGEIWADSTVKLRHYGMWPFERT
jgi:hypothetical protein